MNDPVDEAEGEVALEGREAELVREEASDAELQGDLQDQDATDGADAAAAEAAEDADEHDAGVEGSDQAPEDDDDVQVDQVPNPRRVLQRRRRARPRTIQQGVVSPGARTPSGERTEFLPTVEAMLADADRRTNSMLEVLAAQQASLEVLARRIDSNNGPGRGHPPLKVNAEQYDASSNWLAHRRHLDILFKAYQDLYGRPLNDAWKSQKMKETLPKRLKLALEDAFSEEERSGRPVSYEDQCAWVASQSEDHGFRSLDRLVELTGCATSADAVQEIEALLANVKTSKYAGSLRCITERGKGLAWYQWLDNNNRAYLKDKLITLAASENLPDTLESVQRIVANKQNARTPPPDSKGAGRHGNDGKKKNAKGKGRKEQEKSNPNSYRSEQGQGTSNPHRNRFSGSNRNNYGGVRSNFSGNRPPRSNSNWNNQVARDKGDGKDSQPHVKMFRVAPKEPRPENLYAGLEPLEPYCPEPVIPAVRYEVDASAASDLFESSEDESEDLDQDQSEPESEDPAQQQVQAGSEDPSQEQVQVEYDPTEEPVQKDGPQQQQQQHSSPYQGKMAPSKGNYKGDKWGWEKWVHFRDEYKAAEDRIPLTAWDANDVILVTSANYAHFAFITPLNLLTMQVRETQARLTLATLTAAEKKKLLTNHAYQLWNRRSEMWYPAASIVAYHNKIPEVKQCLTLEQGGQAPPSRGTADDLEHWLTLSPPTITRLGRGYAWEVKMESDAYPEFSTMMTLDTGANVSIIPEWMVDALNLCKASDKTGLTITTVDDRTVNLNSGRVTLLLQTGDRQVEEVFHIVKNEPQPLLSLQAICQLNLFEQMAGAAPDADLAKSYSDEQIKRMIWPDMAKVIMESSQAMADEIADNELRKQQGRNPKRRRVRVTEQFQNEVLLQFPKTNLLVDEEGVTALSYDPTNPNQETQATDVIQDTKFCYPFTVDDRVLLIPPFHQALKYLDSMVPKILNQLIVVLPDWPGQSWYKKYIKSRELQVVKRFPVGSFIFQHTEPFPTAWPILLCKKVKPEVIRSIKSIHDANAMSWRLTDYVRANYNDIIGGLGHSIDLLNHEIELKGDYTGQARRRLNPLHRKVLDNFCIESEAQGLIRKSHARKACNAVFVARKDGDWRICMDYRDLNKVTVKKEPIMERIDEILLESTGKIYSKIDLKNGYYLFDIAEEHRHLTAFYGGTDKYEFLRMPFGLCNASWTFTEAMKTVLDGVPNIHVYLDDILIMADSEKEMKQLITQVLDRLRKHGMHINIDKCTFASKQVDYLGHLLTQSGIKKSPDNVRKIKNFKPPKIIKELQSFLGMVNHYRNFCKDFSKIARPLYNLLKKGTKFQWTQETQLAFQALINSMISDNTLAFPTWDRPFILHTDWSKEAIGAALSQKDDEGIERPIAYYSKTVATNYSAFHGELYALTMALRKFHHIVALSLVHVYTDHRPLTYMKTLQLAGPTARYVLEVSQYNLDIHYLPGSSNALADALSRKVQQLHLQQLNVIDLCGGISTTLHALGDRCHVPEYVNIDFDVDALLAAEQTTLTIQNPHTGSGTSPVCNKSFLNYDIAKDANDILHQLDDLKPHRRKAPLLIVCGWPCQNLSQLNSGPTGIGLRGKRSGIIFDVLELIGALAPDYWILENVDFSKKHADQFLAFNKYVNQQPVTIKWFLPQQRKRLFWSNFKIEALPQDDRWSGTILQDFLDDHHDVIGRQTTAKTVVASPTSQSTTYVMNNKTHKSEKLNIRELIALQGFATKGFEDLPMPADTIQKVIGNAISLPVMEHIVAQLPLFQNTIETLTYSVPNKNTVTYDLIKVSGRETARRAREVGFEMTTFHTPSFALYALLPEGREDIIGPENPPATTIEDTSPSEKDAEQQQSNTPTSSNSEQETSLNENHCYEDWSDGVEESVLSDEANDKEGNRIVDEAMDELEAELRASGVLKKAWTVQEVEASRRTQQAYYSKGPKNDANLLLETTSKMVLGR